MVSLYTPAPIGFPSGPGYLGSCGDHHQDEHPREGVFMYADAFIMLLLYTMCIHTCVYIIYNIQYIYIYTFNNNYY